MFMQREREIFENLSNLAKFFFPIYKMLQHQKIYTLGKIYLLSDYD